MDAQEHRDRGVGSEDPWQWYCAGPIRKRLLAAAAYFVALFVTLLAAYTALDYFFGFMGDQRGNLVGSLADAAARSALFSATYVVLGLPLQCRLQRWKRGNGQQQR
jgi:ABC-type uncharacterized transport system YnjBCD permease subunit